MTGRPLISVALCTYNGERFLREQMESLLAQTYSAIEIVCVDDCSTDGTLELLRQFEARDSRVSVHANHVNLGFKKNFERAMSLCKGQLISPCDQDDIWMPDKLEVLHGFIANCAMAYCDSEFIDERGHSLNRPMSSRCNMVSTDDPVVFAAANCVAGHAMLFRRELLDRAIPVPDCFYFDWWLAAVAAACGGIKFCDRMLVKYRLHSRNVTNVLRERPAVPGRGRRAVRLRDFRRRVEELSTLRGHSDAFLLRMCDLWKAHEGQWLSFALAEFMCRHWDRIYAIQKPRMSSFAGLKFVAGLKLKCLFNPRAYERNQVFE